MKLRFNQLPNQLDKQWLPAWLVAGDEPFQQGEACQLIRDHARQLGFEDRKVFSVDTGIDWAEILNASQSMGLFGGRTLIEIRLGEKRPDKTGSGILCQLLESPQDDVAVLISCSRLDRRRDMNSKWVTAMDQVGAVMEVWPVEANQLPRWISDRLQQKGLQAEADAVALLAERSEGNLLACAQEIDKLTLLCDGETITPLHIQQAVGDSSRHSVFDLTDALAQGPDRSLRVLDGLKAEGTEAAVVLWALAREARILDSLANGQRQGIRLPPQKMAAAEQLARRLGQANINHALLLAARADRCIKGLAPGRPWSLLAGLVMRLGQAPLAETLEQA